MGIEDTIKKLQWSGWGFDPYIYQKTHHKNGIK